MKDAEHNVDVRQLNGITLAYMGDAIYEVGIRRHLIEAGLTKPNRLQHRATRYVSAKAQAGLIALMEAEDCLTSEEWDFYKRGRNAKSYTHAKNTSVITYRVSTGFEALFGFLALTEQTARITELTQWCITQVEAGRVRYAK
ncbi:Mini-ribonuclease 3 [Fructilactobacillus ixorae]|uniref:Mini-ribonuclease 3 n=1 Tax=Fructilactobacillus ixorae TaxID=1750535 RepID=A0ABY5C459_9LACO|nr:Mini-ribonuclease 3 [Fructilactobacillus ixorae]USS93574.1 Mini-ribonuclease 3 [Fructilactobacillus ixorae]